jgi:hypothetical protein
MFWKHFLCALLVAAGLSAVFIAVFRKRDPWGSLLFFIANFLASWAGGLWFTPLGPSVGGVYWLPYLIVGVIFALILLAAVPPMPPDTTIQLLGKGERSGEAKKSMVQMIYFWIMAFALIVLIVYRYFGKPTIGGN